MRLKSMVQFRIMLVVFFSSVLIFSLLGCSKKENSSKVLPESNISNSDEYVVDESDYVKGQDLIEGIEQTSLTEAEISGLVLMREEEKLARDVYQTLGEKWGVNVFSNISSSEQTHTDAIKTLLDRYEIEDPIKDNTVGAFTSDDLLSLYNQLVQQGEKSLLDALKVGATIEDLDINDLNKLTAETDKEDIIIVYNNLNKGSRNHMRAFIKQIDRNGGNYEPKYISQVEFDSIVFSEQERGNVK